jgi:hypothetical protein
MYMADPKTVQAELKAAEEDFRTSVEHLIARNAELRGKRPGGADKPNGDSNAGQS